MMLKYFSLSVLLVCISNNIYPQGHGLINESNKGRIFISGGWNSGYYSNSDLAFKGKEFDFVLSNVHATDRRIKFRIDPYFHPGKFTIPQTNFRVGYFFEDDWNISLGIDHMKYVLQNNQTVSISGEINTGSDIYDGVYDNEQIVLTEQFLKFEHTDGLNYVNVELRHIDRLIHFKNVNIYIIEGGGIGFLFPRTRTEFLEELNSDAYKFSGYGVAPFLGINLTFYDWFFIQSEFKTGYINMPSVGISNSGSAKASQSFFFAQWNYVFGFSRKF